jgi:hypothetical protein
VNRENLILVDRTSKIYRNFICGALLVGALFLSTNISFAQSNIPGTASISTVIAEPTGGEWKSHVEYAAVITSMKASTAKILDNPNLPQPERALYTGFDRMLTYIQADIEAQADITKIPEKNYNKVVQEAPSDPILVNMQISEFTALYTTLVDKLHQ